MLKRLEMPQDPVLRAYLAYSAFIACLAILLVVLLLVPDLPHPMESLSAYYHGENWQRDFFVGTLFAVAVFLLLYKGGWRKADAEAVFLTIGGVAAFFVALFPTDVPMACGVDSGSEPGLPVHGAAAGVLFGSIVVVGVVLPWWRKRRGETVPPRVGYTVAAVIMSAGLALALTGLAERACSPRFLIGEALLVVGFGLFWLVRTLQLANPDVRATLE